jgi:hypothetical protein
MSCFELDQIKKNICIQKDSKDWQPNLFKIITQQYNKTIDTQGLCDSNETTREDSNLLFLSDTTERITF